MRAEPAEEKECMAKEKKRLSVKDGMRLICSAGVCIFLFFLEIGRASCRDRVLSHV